MSNNIGPRNIYNQFVVDVFYNWSKNNEIDWSQIINLEMKSSYLYACYLYGCQVFTIIDNSEVHIKGELISCSEDLYYYLGEKLIGARGYFGSNLDSLEDFLIDVAKNNIIDTCLIFSNTNKIIENTSKYFFDTVIYLLNKAGFDIKITN